MKQTEEIEFKLPHITLKAKKWHGNSEHKILALHGWLDNANTFDRLAPHLPNAEIIALDLAGHGLSGHRPQGTSYYLWEHVLDVAQIIQQLSWKSFALMGHSMGAGIATWYAACWPKQVQELILIDGFGAPFSVKDDGLPQHLAGAFRRFQMASRVGLYGFSNSEIPLFTHPQEAVEERADGKYGKMSPEAARILTERNLYEVEGGYRWRTDPRLVLPTFIEPTEQLIQTFIQQVKAPVHLFLGSEGLFAQGQRQEWLAHFSQLEIQTIEGGHHVHLEENAHEIATGITGFLEAGATTCAEA